MLEHGGRSYSRILRAPLAARSRAHMALRRPATRGPGHVGVDYRQNPFAREGRSQPAVTPCGPGRHSMARNQVDVIGGVE
jgi:hypothetical protein